MAKNDGESISAGKTISAMSGISSILAGLTSAYCSSNPEIQPYSGAFVSGASLAGAAIVYLIAGFINLWGFEPPEIVAYKKKLNADLKFIKKQLKDKDLDQATQTMLNDNKHETLKLLSSVSRTPPKDIKAFQIN